MPFDISTKQTPEGHDVVLHSQKQALIFDSATSEDTPDCITRIVRQFRDGTIFLHRFYFYRGQWVGCHKIIGPRGKDRSIRATVEMVDGKPTMVEDRWLKRYTIVHD